MDKMKQSILRLGESKYPDYLANIPSPPKQLYYIGDLLPLLRRPRLAVVGSRRATPYGKAATKRLTYDAAEQGIVIISGLALGIDAIAHNAALEANGYTIAVMPAGMDRIYPSSHSQLAEQIVLQGGALVGEYPPGTPPMRQNFIARNRIVSGLSDGLLVTEAAAKSGTIHTANFALEQGRSVMSVPGSIFSELSAGTNNLIKAGATPVTSLADILLALDLTLTTSNKPLPEPRNSDEAIIIELMNTGITDSNELLALSKLSASAFNQTLTMLEISGSIKPLGAGHWTL